MVFSRDVVCQPGILPIQTPRTSYIARQVLQDGFKSKVSVRKHAIVWVIKKKT